MGRRVYPPTPTERSLAALGRILEARRRFPWDVDGELGEIRLPVRGTAAHRILGRPYDRERDR